MKDLETLCFPIKITKKKLKGDFMIIDWLKLKTFVKKLTVIINKNEKKVE